MRRTRRYWANAAPRRLFHLGARELQVPVVDDGSGVGGEGHRYETHQAVVAVHSEHMQKVSNRRGGDQANETLRQETPDN